LAFLLVNEILPNHHRTKAMPYQNYVLDLGVVRRYVGPQATCQLTNIRQTLREWEAQKRRRVCVAINGEFSKLWVRAGNID
jgi:hypothetical protein